MNLILGKVGNHSFHQRDFNQKMGSHPKESLGKKTDRPQQIGAAVHQDLDHCSNHKEPGHQSKKVMNLPCGMSGRTVTEQAARGSKPSRAMIRG